MNIVEKIYGKMQESLFQKYKFFDLSFENSIIIDLKLQFEQVSILLEEYNVKEDFFNYLIKQKSEILHENIINIYFLINLCNEKTEKNYVSHIINVLQNECFNKDSLSIIIKIIQNNNYASKFFKYKTLINEYIIKKEYNDDINKFNIILTIFTFEIKKKLIKREKNLDKFNTKLNEIIIFIESINLNDIIFNLIKNESKNSKNLEIFLKNIKSLNDYIVIGINLLEIKKQENLNFLLHNLQFYFNLMKQNPKLNELFLQIILTILESKIFDEIIFSKEIINNLDKINILNYLAIIFDNYKSNKNFDKNIIAIFIRISKLLDRKFNYVIFEEIFYILDEYVLHLVKPSYDKIFEIINSNINECEIKSIAMLIKKSLMHKNIVVAKYIRKFLFENIEKCLIFYDFYELLKSLDDHKICLKFVYSILNTSDASLKIMNNVFKNFYENQKKIKNEYNYIYFYISILSFISNSIKTPLTIMYFMTILNFNLSDLIESNQIDILKDKEIVEKLLNLIENINNNCDVKNSPLFINILIISKNIIYKILLILINSKNLMNNDIKSILNTLKNIKLMIDLFKKKRILEYKLKKIFLPENIFLKIRFSEIINILFDKNYFLHNDFTNFLIESEIFQNLTILKHLIIFLQRNENEKNINLIKILLDEYDRWVNINIDPKILINENNIKLLYESLILFKKYLNKINLIMFDEILNAIVKLISFQVFVIISNDYKDLEKDKQNILVIKLNFLDKIIFLNSNSEYNFTNQIELIKNNFIETWDSANISVLTLKILKFLIFTNIPIENNEIFTDLQNINSINIIYIYKYLKILVFAKKFDSYKILGDSLINFLVDFELLELNELSNYCKILISLFENKNLINFNFVKISLILEKILKFLKIIKFKDLNEKNIISKSSLVFLNALNYFDEKTKKQNVIFEKILDFLFLHTKTNEIFTLNLINQNNLIYSMRKIIINILIQFDYKILKKSLKKSKINIDENIYLNYEKLWPSKYLLLEYIENYNIENLDFLNYLYDSHLKILSNKEFISMSFNNIVNKLKILMLINLTIICKKSPFENYLLNNKEKKINFIEMINMLFLENNSTVKQRQILQQYLISLLLSLKNEELLYEFINSILINNLNNLNLHYQSATSLIIVLAYYLRSILNEREDFSIIMKEICEKLIEKLIVYSSHHFHAVKITAQILLVNLYEEKNKCNKIINLLVNKNLFENVKYIVEMTLNNKELNSIYNSQKFIKSYKFIEETRVENLLIDINETSIYCNIFKKYDKNKNCPIMLYENIKKAISITFDFSIKNNEKNEENSKESFQNRNKVHQTGNLINDIFYEIQKDNNENSLNIFEDKKNKKELIIIASLLENLPNIAGVCRTCEIFGLKEVYIKSTSILKEEAFKRVSVTSENLLNIQELPISKINLFIKIKKEENYKIIALEQANNSIQLNKFEFPNKSIFIIGQEQQGIPSEILNLCDYVIEIPQYGQIKSLNAHVASSIFIWEFSKQRANKIF